MNFSNNEFTLLSEKQVLETQQIDVIKKMGGKCAVSDFAILLGADASTSECVDFDFSLKGRTCEWHLSSSDGDDDVRTIDEYGEKSAVFSSVRTIGIRPVIPFSDINDISKTAVITSEGVLEVKYGEYPQYSVDESLENTLKSIFQTLIY